MLASLEIRDLLIIDHLRLDFAPGLNVLTGETGAGKSILLDALGFALGWPQRGIPLRAGAERGEVEAVFELDTQHPVREVLEEAGLGAAEDGLILRRILTASGRRNAFVNERRVSAETLRAISDRLLELHGQHDDKGLMDPATHLEILDDYAGLQEQLRRQRTLWESLSMAARQLEEAELEHAKAQAEEDWLRHALNELETLAPEAGEEAELDSRRRLMRAAAQIADEVQRAMEAIVSDEGAERRLGDALRRLEAAADKAERRLDEPIEQLGQALDAAARAQQGIERALADMAFDPHELERIEERLFAIRALARKHDLPADELPELAADLHRRLAALEDGAARLSGLKAALEDAQAAHDEGAEALSRARHEAAGRLDGQVMAELAPLKMERAQFQTLVSRGAPGPRGIDQVCFSVATNPGAPPGPLNRIASGGELSRFLLALKLCVAGSESRRTMIFDEIDRGVGGATADAVGRRLARLAEGRQVLAVTHSPQVAARASHHIRIEKAQSGSQTLSRAYPLKPEERIEELARMISGETITEEARAAARALLKG